MWRWIEKHAALFLVIALAGLGYLGSELKSVQSQLATSSRTQLLNRATNVEHWCGGINEGRDYDRHFVEGFHLKYTLKDLPCAQFIAKTLESARHPTPVTRKSNPQTYSVLHPH